MTNLISDLITTAKYLQESENAQRLAQNAERRQRLANSLLSVLPEDVFSALGFVIGSAVFLETRAYMEAVTPTYYIPVKLTAITEGQHYRAYLEIDNGSAIYSYTPDVVGDQLLRAWERKKADIAKRLRNFQPIRDEDLAVIAASVPELDLLYAAWVEHNEEEYRQNMTRHQQHVDLAALKERHAAIIAAWQERGAAWAAEWTEKLYKPITLYLVRYAPTSPDYAGDRDSLIQSVVTYTHPSFLHTRPTTPVNAVRVDGRIQITYLGAFLDAVVIDDGSNPTTTCARAYHRTYRWGDHYVNVPPHIAADPPLPEMKPALIDLIIAERPDLLPIYENEIPF